MEKQAVMFSDIVGSTRLYEQLGDELAQAEIEDCLLMMQEAIKQCGGEVVKTIGDEVLSVFYQSDGAVQAAMNIIQATQKRNQQQGVPLRVRTGIHYGEVIRKKDDVFGDTVNVASRLSHIATSDQIITSKHTLNSLDMLSSLRSRDLPPIMLKGKKNQMLVCEIIAETANLPQDLTVVETQGPMLEELDYLLMFERQKVVINKLADGATVGRMPNCDLVMDMQTASRVHAKLEYYMGKVVYTDQSTNGSYIRMPWGDETFVHRESLTLAADCWISLGVPFSKNKNQRIYFSLAK